jgi:hypothetical protein
MQAPVIAACVGAYFLVDSAAQVTPVYQLASKLAGSCKSTESDSLMCAEPQNAIWRFKLEVAEPGKSPTSIISTSTRKLVTISLRAGQTRQSGLRPRRPTLKVQKQDGCIIEMQISSLVSFYLARAWLAWGISAQKGVFLRIKSWDVVTTACNSCCKP